MYCRILFCWNTKQALYKADYDHEHELDKESHFTLGELNYDKTLVQVQINYDWCSPSSTIMITKFWSVLNYWPNIADLFYYDTFYTEDKVKRFKKKITIIHSLLKHKDKKLSICLKDNKCNSALSISKCMSLVQEERIN